MADFLLLPTSFWRDFLFPSEETDGKLYRTCCLVSSSFCTLARSYCRSIRIHRTNNSMILPKVIEEITFTDCFDDSLSQLWRKADFLHLRKITFSANFTQGKIFSFLQWAPQIEVVRISASEYSQIIAPPKQLLILPEAPEDLRDYSCLRHLETTNCLWTSSCNFPSSLTSLTLGNVFTESLDCKSLPPTLLSLELKEEYEHLLSTEDLPRSLTSLIIPLESSAVLKVATLPPNLQVLQGGCNSISVDSLEELPRSLRVLRVFLRNDSLKESPPHLSSLDLTSATGDIFDFSSVEGLTTLVLRTRNRRLSLPHLPRSLRHLNLRCGKFLWGSCRDLPPLLQSLQVRNLFLPLTWLPPSLEFFNISGDYFDQNKPLSFPSGLQKLELLFDQGSDFSLNNLPPTLKELSIEEYRGDFFSQNLPRTLEKLVINKFRGSWQKFTCPPYLKHLSLPKNFCSSLVLPETLLFLCCEEGTEIASLPDGLLIGASGLSVSPSGESRLQVFATDLEILNPSSLPRGLRRVFVNSCATIISGVWPEKLKVLGIRFVKEPEDCSGLTNLPEGLLMLWLSGDFNQSLPLLPRSLQELHCGDNFNRPLSLQELPELRFLDLGRSYRQILPLDSLPKNLRTLRISHLLPSLDINNLPPGLNIRLL